MRVFNSGFIFGSSFQHIPHMFFSVLCDVDIVKLRISKTFYWRLIELPWWLKSAFCLKFYEMSITKYAEDNFMQGDIQLMQGKIEHQKNWKFRVLKFYQLYDFLLNFLRFPMFGSVSPHIKSTGVNPCEVRLTRSEIKWATKVKSFTPCLFPLFPT